MLTLVVAILGPMLCAALVVAGYRAEAAHHVRALKVRPRWRVPARWRPTLVTALADADLNVEPEAAIERWVVSIATAGLLAAALTPTFAIPAVVTGIIAGPVGLRMARTRRERRFVEALPGGLEQVAAELRGGGTVAAATARLADSGGALGADFRRVHTRTELGLPLREALARWPDEHDAPGVRAAAGALAVAATMGGRAADAIDGLAASLRQRIDAIAEARALSAQAKLSAVVVGAAPIGYLAFSSLVDPHSVTVLLTTGVGRVCLVVGLALEALAALSIRRIVRAEPS